MMIRGHHGTVSSGFEISSMACMVYIINLQRIKTSLGPTAVSKTYSLLRYVLAELSAMYILACEYIYCITATQPVF